MGVAILTTDGYRLKTADVVKPPKDLKEPKKK